MISLIAHILSISRRRDPVRVNGLYWAYCGHRSHRLGLHCWRWYVYDGLCDRHQESCYTGCARRPHE